MKIDSYAVMTSAERSYQKLTAESLNANWGQNAALPSIQPSEDAVVVEISDEGRQKASENRQKQTPKRAAVLQPMVPATYTGGLATNPQELKLQLLDSLLFALTGKRLNPQLVELLNPQARRQPAFGAGRVGGFARGGGSGAQVTVTRLDYERETVDYDAKGVVKTADGKTIELDVNMHMSREFYAYSQASLSLGGGGGNCIDPLLINYGGSAASLSGEKFSFDLDADGAMDQISFTGPGSGFLALDKNNDGSINDGSELFGPGTGNGFGELRMHDGDKNRWIDESDAVFSQLRIWSKDADGNDQLFTLQELGIGAIYLGETQTEFSLYDAGGNASGIMRSTSFFLREDGSAGTLSHIDLVV